MNASPEQILKQLEGFRYPESAHFDADQEPLAIHKGDGVALAFVPHPHVDVNVLWGADSVEQLDSGLRAAIQANPVLNGKILKLGFVPEAFEGELCRQGFRTTSEWIDAWLAGLADYATTPGGHILIRQLKDDDCPACAGITRACRGISRDFMGETDEFIREWLSEAPNTGFMAFDGETPVGAALTTIYGAESPRGPICWLRELAVAPAFQRRGIGRELALTVLQWGRMNGATRSFLHVDRENPAIRLYRSLGFEPKTGRGEINMIATTALDGGQVKFRSRPSARSPLST